MDDLETNPTPGTPGEGVAQEEQPEIETEGDEGQQPDGEQPDGEAADDAEDVDIDGETYRLPKKLKDRFMMQADYTQKTQEVAAERKTLATERQRIDSAREQFAQHAEAQGRNLQDMARIVSIGDQVAAYKKLDWPAIEAQDRQNNTNEAGRLFREMTMLEQQAQGIANELYAKEQHRQSETQQATAKRLEEAQATFAKEIPGWNTGTKQQMWDYAIEKGVTADALGSTTDPVLMSILYEASRWHQYVAKQRAAVKTATPQRPAAKPVQQVAARRSPATGPSDKDSMEDWLAKRNKQVAQARSAG